MALVHFDNHRPESRMPWKDEVDPRTGISYEGSVLTGKTTVPEAIWNEARRAQNWNNAAVRPDPANLDPVLRHHLRLDQQ